MSDDNEEHDIHEYGEAYIRSANAPVPKWLIATYIILPIWGVITFMLFWNGSRGWLDRGYWEQLQHAANTTIPQQNVLEIQQKESNTPRIEHNSTQRRKDAEAAKIKE